ncbi:thiamine diphosphokinase [Oscillospiraceae bacterium PP1C4]
MKRCIVLSGGPVSDYDQVSLCTMPDDFIVACDAGYLAAQHFGLKPDLLVGDFDSYHGEVDPGVEVLTVPAKKNDTDTLLGIKIGLENGCREFIIVGGFGGRLDHTIANLQVLSFLCEQGAQGMILANDNRAWAIRDSEITIPRLENYHISVFAWGDTCTGVTLAQLAYPLTDYTLTPTFPLGISNEFTEDTAKISVKQGTLLIIASKESTVSGHC